MLNSPHINCYPFLYLMIIMMFTYFHYFHDRFLYILLQRPSLGGLNLPISHFIFGQSPCSQIGAPAYFHNFPAPAPILDLNLPSPTSFLHNLPNLPLFSPNLPSPKYPIEGLITAKTLNNLFW